MPEPATKSQVFRASEFMKTNLSDEGQYLSDSITRSPLRIGRTGLGVVVAVAVLEGRQDFGNIGLVNITFIACIVEKFTDFLVQGLGRGRGDGLNEMLASRVNRVFHAPG